MWTEGELEELLSYQPGHPVLSVYLDLEPGASSSDAHKLHLRELTRPFEDEVGDDIEALIRFVEHEHDGSGRSLVLFTCQADGYFRSFQLAVPIRSRARLLDRPYVKPLADLLDTYGHFGLALVDRQQTRLYHLHLGEIQAERTVVGEDVRHTKRGGGSQAAGRRGGSAGQTRYAEEVAERNLRKAATEAGGFLRQHKVRRVLLGGAEDTLAFFTEALPKSWQSVIVGTFPISMNAGPSEVVGKALQVAAEAEAERESKLVERMVTAAAKGAEGTLTLDETLGAVHEGRVQTLIVAEGYRQPGYRCRGCEYISVQKLQTCPFCDNEFDRIDDAVEMAVRDVMAQGGKVEIVRDNSQLIEAGSIGALLRY